MPGTFCAGESAWHFGRHHTIDIVHPAIEKYLEKLSPPSVPVLREIEGRADHEDFPIVGPLVGRLLAVLAKAINARLVFEMGSGYGYSGLWFASALPDGGKVNMTDASSAYAKDAKTYFARAHQDDKYEFLVGDAIELIEQVPGPFDIIFIDIDKARYPLAFRKALPKLRVGGLFIADNVLWFGSVVTDDPDPDVVAIKQFGRLLHETQNLWSTIIPLRDGVSVSIKLA